MDKNSLLDCSFLEVTINSNKLMQILEKLMKQVQEHTNEIKILRDAIPTIKQSLAISLETTEARVKLETEKSALKIREEMNLVRVHQESSDQQLARFTIQTQRNLKEKQDQLLHLSQEKKRIQSLISLYEQNRLTSHNKIYEQLLATKETVQQVKKEISQAQNKTDDKFQMMFIKMQSMIKKSNMNSRGMDVTFDMKTKKERNTSTFPKAGAKSTISSTSMANWAAFSTKISQFENKIEQRQKTMPFMNKALHSKRIPVDETSEEVLQSSQIIDYEAFPRENTNNFQSLFSLCNKENQKNLENIKNKLVIHEEKLGVHFRKMEKMLQTHSQFKLMFKKLQQKRTQEHNLELIKNQIKKLHLQFEEEMDKKLNKDTFDRERTKTHEKISILQENLTEKADKGDMKKAFLFMEEKIKQLIILIAKDQNDQKDGAIKKIPAKCLSCDKGLELQNCPPNSMPSSSVTSRENQVNLRTVTRKIRSRMHTSNQNSSTNL